MKKFNLPLKAGGQFIENFTKSPFSCEINVIPTKGRITISPGKDTMDDAKPYFDSELYDVIPTYHQGGTLVWSDDQVIYAVFDNKPILFVGEKIVAFLKERGIKAWMDGNDILCDWHKVGAEMITPMGDSGYSFYGFYLSISVDADLINAVSSKPMRKPPRGLSHYGITRQDILNLLGLSDE